ncbi:biotin--[acetyl-CoA-carboxylase] ligase [Undibacterium sp. LX40W]|uniref:biotin--[biotin carboxyl-carrier protein] ligase n=1 Tax=Undibacterium nitidum TaxID=2762298 RepID=A0A923HVX9_9BURK|nr:MULTISPECIES: biotin--[acetyl-CoA-carboxylase] ligase [Undibacterium]MBC3881111.1 biotin--[acetyl-CoA-carboxylase] ligase [Undibacterium nitidum]MBC3890156.1 biotin--[acetyl-CoA-carboxylase] ligase [Undibacterium sp. LX40W]
MLFNASVINAFLAQLNQQQARQLELAVEVVAETGSTNLDLMQRTPQLRQATLRVAENQTAGRGRAGRTWLSTPGGVLTFSLAWHFAKPAHSLSAVPLVVGVAVAECLRHIGVQVHLKWPNDILKEGRKLAGILVESAAAPEGGTWVVIGLGLNLQVPAELEQEIGQAVADSTWLAQMDRNQLLAQLAHAIGRAMQVFDEYGFEVFVERWNQLHAYAGQFVRIMEQSEILHQGQASGVDAMGRLQLLVDGKLIAIHAGDVSLRPLA